MSSSSCTTAALQYVELTRAPTLTFVVKVISSLNADERLVGGEQSSSACLHAQLCLGFIREHEAYRTHQLRQPSITVAAAAEG